MSPSLEFSRSTFLIQTLRTRTLHVAICGTDERPGRQQQDRNRINSSPDEFVPRSVRGCRQRLSQQLSWRGSERERLCATLHGDPHSVFVSFSFRNKPTTIVINSFCTWMPPSPPSLPPKAASLLISPSLRTLSQSHAWGRVTDSQLGDIKLPSHLY